MKRRKLVWGALLLLAILPALAHAQGANTVRVLQAAAVVEQLGGSSNTVGTVRPGQLLEVLDKRDDWYLVRQTTTSATAWKTGWISAANVAPMQATQTGVTQAPQESVSRPATRRGFIVGIGGGVAYHREPLFRGGSTNNVGATTDFRVGYAPTNQLLVYYTNKVGWTSGSSYDAVGMSGAALTYMFSPNPPSAFVSGAAGAAAGMNLDGFGGGQTGAAFSAGGGIEFARHWSVDGEAVFLTLGGIRHTVFKGAVNWLFY